jgi:hypothetical protein
MTSYWTLDNLGLDHRFDHYTDLLVPYRFSTISSDTMTPVIFHASYVEAPSLAGYGLKSICPSDLPNFNSFPSDRGWKIYQISYFLL